MHGVPRAVRDDVSQNLLAQKRQVAYQVQNLVPHKFIGEAQRRIHQTIPRKHNRVFLRGPADQALLPHGFGFVKKTECPLIVSLPVTGADPSTASALPVSVTIVAELKSARNSAV